MIAQTLAHCLASCSPIKRCSRLIPFSGRTITLKCVILPSSLKVMMSTPLILMPEFEHRSVSAAPFACIFEAGAAKDLLGARQIFEGDVAPALRRVDDGTFEHRIRVKEIPQRRRVMG